MVALARHTLIGFTIMDGFDLGIAAILPFIGRSDTERRLMINLVGPVWEGNQKWLITAGGVIFAASGRHCMQLPSRAFIWR